MPVYKYICPSCGHKYSETRLSTDPQWYTTCVKCLSADFVEDTE